MKRLICLIMAVVLVASLFGCTSSDSDNTFTSKSFDGQKDFSDFLSQKKWLCEESLENGKVKYHLMTFSNGYCYVSSFQQGSRETMREMFCRIIVERFPKYDAPNTDLITFLSSPFATSGYTIERYTPKFDAANGTLTSNDHKWQVQSANNGDTRIVYNDLNFISSESTYLEWNACFALAIGDMAKLKGQQKEQEKQAFLNRYPNLPSASDVRYDPVGYRGKNFIIQGSISLDDYFNYEYRGTEYSNFCIQITPPGGYYSDSWYIYANRSTFSTLFEQLKTGSRSNVILICKAKYGDATKNRMATLVDFYIG